MSNQPGSAQVASWQPGDARLRIAAQLPVAEKLRHATEKIDCSGSLEATRAQVAALAAKLRRPSKELSS